MSGVIFLYNGIYGYVYSLVRVATCTGDLTTRGELGRYSPWVQYFMTVVLQKPKLRFSKFMLSLAPYDSAHAHTQVCMVLSSGKVAFKKPSIDLTGN